MQNLGKPILSQALLNPVVLTTNVFTTITHSLLRTLTWSPLCSTRNCESYSAKTITRYFLTRYKDLMIQLHCYMQSQGSPSYLLIVNNLISHSKQSLATMGFHPNHTLFALSCKVNMVSMETAQSVTKY